MTKLDDAQKAYDNAAAALEAERAKAEMRRERQMERERAARTERAQKIVDNAEKVREALAEKIKDAARARDDAAETLDVSAMVQSEALYLATCIARNLHKDEVSAATRIVEGSAPNLPDYRERPSELFPLPMGEGVHVSDGSILRAVRAFASANAPRIYAATREECGVPALS